MLGEVYPRWLTWTLNLGGAVVALAAIFCLWLGFHWHDASNETVKACVLSAWVVGVPLWFSIEYFFIYKFLGLDNRDKNAGNNSSGEKVEPQQKDRFEHFKYGQEIATKAWLAVITVLTGLYFGAAIPFFHKNPEPTNQVVVECKQCPCSIVKP